MTEGGQDNREAEAATANNKNARADGEETNSRQVSAIVNGNEVSVYITSDNHVELAFFDGSGKPIKTPLRYGSGTVDDLPEILDQQVRRLQSGKRPSQLIRQYKKDAAKASRRP